MSTLDGRGPDRSPVRGGTRLALAWPHAFCFQDVTAEYDLGRHAPGVAGRQRHMAATLDIVSGGRLELGLGTGWNQEESSAYGIELGTPKERSDRFEEACEVITGLLSRESTTFKGSSYELTGARCNPKPVQRPYPSLCIGGSGEKRTLRTAARFAQHWNFDSGTVGRFIRARRTPPVLRRRPPGPGGDPAVEPGAVQRRSGRDGGQRRRARRGRCGACHRLSAAALHRRRAGTAGNSAGPTGLSPGPAPSAALRRPG